MNMNSFDGEIRIVTLRVADWSQAVSYYRGVLGLTQKFADEVSEYAMFEAGPVRFAIEGPVKPALERGPASGALVANFQVEDLARTIKNLSSAGARLLSEVRHGQGYDFVGIADPEGNEHIVFQRTA